MDVPQITFGLWSTLVTISTTYAVYVFVQKWRFYQEEKAFGERHGCLPMETKIPYQWPLALDVLKLQYDALPSKRVLAFQRRYLDKSLNLKLNLFGQTGYMITDPKNLESILSSRFEDWGIGNTRSGLRMFIGEGIFTQDGRPWRHSREMLRRQFVRMNFKNLSIFDQHVDDLVAGLASSAPKGVVDLQPAFFRFTLATTTALIFGEPVSDLGHDDHDTFGRAFDYASYISAIRIRLTDFHWLYSPKGYTQACVTVKRYADHFINKALEADNRESESHALILDLFDELKDRNLVRDQLCNVLIAGRDTTACTMSWAFFLLVRHPQSLEKLRKEITTVVSSEKKLTRAHLQRMSYLKCILNETLRLYPQIPVNVRLALKTTLLPTGGGPDRTAPVLVRKGTGCAWSVYHMHRRTEIYGPDANKFRPERWENTDLASQVGYGYLPFHGGPRLCLGQEFALIEASYGIVSVIRKFPRLRLPPGEQIEPPGEEKQDLTIVVSSHEGCKVLLE